MLPGLTTLPPQDRDEPRFAQASKQMLETGDFIDIRFGGEARNKKPAGIHWMQAAAVRLGELVEVPDARRTIWLYRLPSLAGALAAVLLTSWAALGLTSPRNAFLAALLMSATALLGVEARLATTDAVLAATVVGCMGPLGRAFMERDSKRPLGWGPCLLFWGALAIGLLVKGPITPMVPLFAAIVLSVRERGARWLLALRPAAGGLLCLALVLPWFVAILLRTNGGFLAEAVGHDMLGKVAGAQERHGLPPGSYLAAFWLSGWPLAPFAVLAAPALWRSRREDATAFLLAWLVPSWLMFEAVPTKLFHYVLPLYPALAIAVVIGLARRLARAPVSAPSLCLYAGLTALVPLAVFVAMLALRPLLFTVTPLTLAAGAGATLAALVLAGGAVRALSMRDAEKALLCAAACAVPVYAFALGLLPSPSVAGKAAVSPRLAAMARTALGPACVEPRYATAGDREPSLMFVTGTDLVLTDPAGAARFMAEGGCRAAFVEQAGEGDFLRVLGVGEPVRLAGRVGGLLLNGGKPLDIGVYVRQ